MVELFESLGFQISDRTPAELPNGPQISSQPHYAGLSTSISQDLHPPAPLIPAVPMTGPLPFPDFIPRATTSCGVETRPTSSAPEIRSVRPFTAPLSLSQMLPPKRVLPFPSKNQKPSTPDSEKTPSCSLPEDPEFAVNPVTADSNKALTATASGAHTLSPEALTTNAAISQNPVEPPGNTTTLADAEMIDVPSTPEVPPTIPKSRSTASIPVKKAGKPRRKPPSKPKEVIEPRKNPKSRTGPSKTPNQAPNVFEDVEPADFMARLDGWVRQYQHLPAPRPLESTSENLTSYAAQSKEERMMIIDEMICKSLEDENFVKLVEDVGESWRRIGLGL